MRTLEKAIQIILDTKVDPVHLRKLITNERLVGKKPHTELEEYGVSAAAGELRAKVRDEMENKHGIGLVPWDYKGTWQIVDINEVAAERVYKRMEKLQNTVRNAENLVLEYQTHPMVSVDMEKTLKSVHRVIDFQMTFLEEALEPKLSRVQKLLENHRPEAAA